MAVDVINPGDDSETTDDERTREGVDEIQEGAEIIEKAIGLNRVADILRSRGLENLVSRVQDASREVERAGYEEIQHGMRLVQEADEHQKAHQVATLVLHEPQYVASWQGPIKAITRVVDRSVPVEDFIAAAHGDVEVGHKRREETLHLGDWLTRVEAGAIRTTEEALRVGLAIVSFIADVETIRDHVPASVWRAIWTALESLFEFLPFLRFA